MNINFIGAIEKSSIKCIAVGRKYLKGGSILTPEIFLCRIKYCNSGRNYCSAKPHLGFLGHPT
jgi:hypothetical protein